MHWALHVKDVDSPWGPIHISAAILAILLVGPQIHIFSVCTWRNIEQFWAANLRPCNEQCLQAFLVIWTFDDIWFVDLSLETVRVFWTVSRVFFRFRLLFWFLGSTDLPAHTNDQIETDCPKQHSSQMNLHAMSLGMVDILSMSPDIQLQNLKIWE